MGTCILSLFVFCFCVACEKERERITINKTTLNTEYAAQFYYQRPVPPPPSSTLSAQEVKKKMKLTCESIRPTLPKVPKDISKLIPIKISKMNNRDFEALVVAMKFEKKNRKKEYFWRRYVILKVLNKRSMDIDCLCPDDLKDKYGVFEDMKDSFKNGDVLAFPKDLEELA